MLSGLIGFLYLIGGEHAFHLWHTNKYAGYALVLSIVVEGLFEIWLFSDDGSW